MKQFIGYYADDTENASSADVATQSFDGLMSKEDKKKLDSIAPGAGTGVSQVEASNVLLDADHRFVTDKEKETWNSKPNTKEELGLSNVTNDEQVKRSEMGTSNGVATLDESGKVPTSQLPEFVSDVKEYDTFNSLPTTGESGKLYFVKDTNKSYRWGGTQYISIADSLALGETSATAYAGDKGKALADEVDKIKSGETVVPNAVDATTVGGLTVKTAVPEDAKFTDTVYTHPESHPAAMITTDETHHFVTNDQLAKIDAIPEDPKYTDTIYVHPESHPAIMITEDDDHKFANKTQLEKVDNIPDDPKYTDTVYTHPDTHPATMIEEDETHRFVTDEEKAIYEGKANSFAKEPYYLEKIGAVFGCSVPITITKSNTEGFVTVSYDTKDGVKTLEAKENCIVYGGGYGIDESVHYPSTSVTVNSGKVKTIYGGSLSNSVVGTTNVIINGGTITEGVNGGGAAYDDARKCSSSNSVGSSNVIINNTDNEVVLVFAGGQGYSTVGHAKATINGGRIQYLTAAGSNGHTIDGELVVNGGTIKVLQGCNRGTVGNVDIAVNDGTIATLYAGGETADKGVTATYEKAKVTINGGTITKLEPGTSGGVENTEKVSGTYVKDVVSDDQAAKLNLVKQQSLKDITMTMEGKVLSLKLGDTVLGSVDLSTINE